MKLVFLISAALSVLMYIVVNNYSRRLSAAAKDLWLEINSSINIVTNPITKKKIEHFSSLSELIYNTKENKKASAFVFLSFLFFVNSSISLSYFFQYLLFVLGGGKHPDIMSEVTIFMAALPAAISIKFAISISDSRDRFLSVYDYLSPFDADIPLCKLQAIKQNASIHSYITKVFKSKRSLTRLEWSLLSKELFNEDSDENKALSRLIKKELFFNNEG